MTALVRIVALVGWRGAVGLLAGGAIAASAALPLGRWVERQVCSERIARGHAEERLQEMENENARINAALDARRRADRDSLGAGDGGLPDDGFRRD